MEVKCNCHAVAKISYHQDILHLQIDNISTTFKHTRVYTIDDEIRTKMTQDLKHKSALAVRSQIVNERIPDNKKLSSKLNPMVPTLNAIRLFKNRENKVLADPMDVLLYWKDHELENIITGVGHSPFYVFFQTLLQLAWYIAESKKGPLTHLDQW